MRVLVTGGTGLVGRYLLRHMKDHAEILATHLEDKAFDWIPGVRYCRMDVADRENVVRIFREADPDIVVHTASIGDVDFCERHKDKARSVNLEGTGNALDGARSSGAKFIFISSNAIFDGKRPFYKETDEPNPVNYYGTLKVETENMVSNSALEYAIVRPILMYGWNDQSERPNPVTWLLAKLRKKENVRVVDDIYCTPLLADACARALRSIIVNDKRGIYHIGGRDRVSRFDFAVKTAETFGLDRGLIEPVPNSYFKSIASRPKDTSYSTEKMEKELDMRPIGVEEGLSLMMSERERLSCPQ